MWKKTDKDSHKTLPVLAHSQNRMETLEMRPFQLFIKAGFGGIMVGHLEIPSLEPTTGMPSSASKRIISGYLREQFGFNGLVFTDGLAMEGARKYPDFCIKSLIAGTADLIIDHGDNEFSVGDFKTNERIEYSSKYGKFLLDDFSHLTDCNYTIYTLQMSLYAYMYSLLSGRRCRQLFLMWIDRMNGNRMHFIPAPYLYHDICRLIDKRKREIMMKK